MKYQFLFATLIIFISTSSVYSHQLINSYLRTTSDMRDVSNALEVYFIDNNQYPTPSHIPPYGLEKLTTPVMYITSIPADAFSNPDVQPKVDESLYEFHNKRQSKIINAILFMLSVLSVLYGLISKNREVLKISIIIFIIFLFVIFMTVANYAFDIRMYLSEYWKIINFKSYPEVICNGHGYHTPKTTI